MILDLLKNVLSDTQYYKIKRLIDSYPGIFDGEEIVKPTGEISKNTGIRSDHVIRDLKKISSLCSRLVVESVLCDSYGNEITEEKSRSVEETKVKRGGRHISRCVKLQWKKYE